MIEDVVVIGAAGQGRMCIDIIERMTNHGEQKLRVRGVYDDAPTTRDLAKLQRRKIPYLGSIQDLVDSGQSTNVVIGIGYPTPRRSVVKKLREFSFNFPTIIDPSVVLGSQIEVGCGTVIASGAHVSTSCTIGDFVHLNPGAIIGHDVVIDNYAAINPGAIVSGDVSIGDATLVGAGAIVLQG